MYMGLLVFSHIVLQLIGLHLYCFTCCLWMFSVIQVIVIWAIKSRQQDLVICLFAFTSFISAISGQEAIVTCKNNKLTKYLPSTKQQSVQHSTQLANSRRTFWRILLKSRAKGEWIWGIYQMTESMSLRGSLHGASFCIKR